MSNPELLMLFERLFHPVPRVRWEAGCGVAHLIRERDRDATDAFLNWINKCQLESEVVLGLGIIDAYDLGSFFKFSDVLAVIHAPSHLSDYLLKKNFTNTGHLSPFRYAVTPTELSTLPHEEKTWFERYRKRAVPPIFSETLKELQQHTSFPFYVSWERNWHWLQATYPRPEAEYRHFFSRGDRSYTGLFDHGQRELYVSAYLRTLAHASLCGEIPSDVADNHSRLAITMNRGLADLEPIARPDWARNLFPCDAEQMKQLAKKLWVSAEEFVKPEEVPLAIRVVDHSMNGFIEFDIILVVGPPGFITGPAEVRTYNTTLENVDSDEMNGPIEQRADITPFLIKRPLAAVQGVCPRHIGRTHAEVALQIRLAQPSIFSAPTIFGTPASVTCSPSDICLEIGDEVLSRWIYWYADWEPVVFPELLTSVSSVTTISKTQLNKLCGFPHIEIAQLVKIRQGVRDGVCTECEIESDVYWCNGQGGH